MQSDAVQWKVELWVRVELSSGSSSSQTLFIAVGVHSEAAVAASPVITVGGKTVRDTRNFRSAAALLSLSLMWTEFRHTTTEKSWYQWWCLYLADAFWGGMLHARSSSLSYRRGLSKKYPLEERTWFGIPAVLYGDNESTSIKTNHRDLLWWHSLAITFIIEMSVKLNSAWRFCICKTLLEPLKAIY